MTYDEAPREDPSPPSLTAEEADFRRELLRAAAELDHPAGDLAARIAAQLPRTARRWGLAWRLTPAGGISLAAAVALLGVGAGVLLGRAGAGGDAGPGARPEALSLRPEPPARSAAPSASTPALDPCARRYRAAGGAPLVDDFEDGDGVALPSEERDRDWSFFRDFDRPGQRPRSLIPELARRPGSPSRRALHLTGPELQDWGAVLELAFAPHYCYDASAYGGLSFWARGPGRLVVGVRENRVVPTAWGGTCADDCYNSHARIVNLSARWERYELPWAALRQRGYEMPPVDPTSLHSLQFLVQAADTPFDFWLDDVEFLPKAGGG